jgi:hypothetical protein
MRKADKIKLSVIVGVSLLAFVVGCVDTAVQPIPTTIDYKSDVNIVNLAAGTGAATVNVYHAVVDQNALAQNTLQTKIDYSSATMSGTAIAMGSTLPASTYQEIPSGGLAVVVTYANSAAKDTFLLSADSQYKMRLFIVGDTSAAGRSLVKGAERYIWQTPGSTEGAQLFPAGSGWLKVFNGCPDTSITKISIDIQDAATDSSYDKGDLTFQNATAGDRSGYFQLPTGKNYNLIVTAGTTVDTVAFTPASQKRYTAVVYDYAASLQVKILTDD